MLQNLKNIIRDQIGMPPWAVLLVLGGLAHVLLNAVLKKPFTSAWGMIGAVVLGVAIESWEIWMQYRHIGLFAPGNDPVWTIIGRHSLDVVTMVLGALSIVLAGRMFAP